MKVAFYYFNIYPSTIDCSNVNAGNPGIGGTEYIMLLVAGALHKRDNGIQVRLYSSSPGNFDSSMDVKVIDNYDEAARDAAASGFEVFVINQEVKWFREPFKGLPPSLKIVVWCHNFRSPYVMEAIARNVNVGRIVCVSNEQADLFRDAPSYRKTQCIFNCVPINDELIEKASRLPYNKRKHVVTYLSCINPGKGFHKLARIWPSVLKQVPDAQLYVIGNGKLYYHDTQLGKYHIATEDYENSFMPYLTDTEGNILDSVHFMGVMGTEKDEILLQTRVGVFPSMTETFCLSAVEMQAMGCSVVTMSTAGSFDVVYNGLVARDDNQLLRHIVKLLTQDEVKPYDKTIQYIQDNFSLDNVASQWEELLHSDFAENKKVFYPLHHPTYRFKWLKECIRLAKVVCPFMRRDKIITEKLLRKLKYAPEKRMF